MKVRKSFLVKFVLVTLLLGLCGWSCNRQPQEVKITIFHVNDIHAKIDNFAKIAWVVKEERKTNPNVFFVNAGDNFSGNPIVDQYKPKGEPVFELMNMMGYDVLELGNHEFDYGKERLKKFMTEANFKILCANVQFPETGELPKPLPFVILKTKEGAKIAMLGLIQIEKKSRIPSTHPDKIKGMVFSDGIETALKYKHLKKENDLLIAISHLGYEVDEVLAQKMAELDLIVGGHSHTKIEHPGEINGVLVAQAGSYAKYLGRIDLTIKGGEIISHKASLIDIKTVAGEIPEIKEKIIEYNKNPVLNKVFKSIPKNLEGKPVLGNLITDAVTNIHGLDIAFHNNGGIRTHYMKKDIRLKDIYTILPFGNYIIHYKLTPAEIKSLLKNDFSRRKEIDLRVSGITYNIIHDADFKVLDIELRDKTGKLLDEEKKYNVGLNDYVASAYAFDHQDQGTNLNMIVAETLIKYLETSQDVTKGLMENRTLTTLK